MGCFCRIKRVTKNKPGKSATETAIAITMLSSIGMWAVNEICRVDVAIVVVGFDPRGD
ncbi:hypothetical protein W822_07195 [Advenella kashmirensis W13003]|uniref:Uncharacterized protein n=1 Tax=Advenella kashmirensis W13003 TaxID=1424334 RepID=V8QVU7_9BURK|nr:hypothetical protein W822_07195 [Advenella kashmirensis W13003]